jgi:hypothetical protein
MSVNMMAASLRCSVSSPAICPASSAHCEQWSYIILFSEKENIFSSAVVLAAAMTEIYERPPSPQARFNPAGNAPAGFAGEAITSDRRCSPF